MNTKIEDIQKLILEFDNCLPVYFISNDFIEKLEKIVDDKKKTSKITLATIKSFIKREFQNKNLHYKVLSSFSGMTDCVESQENNFSKVESINFENEYNLGIPEISFANRSADYFTNFEDEYYKGYEVNNCVGSFILAIKK